MTQLPGLAGEIEEVIGLERTVALLRARGGTEIALPKRIPGSHLEQLVGTWAAEQMVAYFGAGKLVLPCAALRGVTRYNAERKARALAMLRDGRSLQSVALACDLNMRTVSKYRAELKLDTDESAQGKLPL